MPRASDSPATLTAATSQSSSVAPASSPGDRTRPRAAQLGRGTARRGRSGPARRRAAWPSSRCAIADSSRPRRLEAIGGAQPGEHEPGADGRGDAARLPVGEQRVWLPDVGRRTRPGPATRAARRRSAMAGRRPARSRRWTSGDDAKRACQKRWRDQRDPLPLGGVLLGEETSPFGYDAESANRLGDTRAPLTARPRRHGRRCRDGIDHGEVLDAAALTPPLLDRTERRPRLARLAARDLGPHHRQPIGDPGTGGGAAARRRGRRPWRRSRRSRAPAWRSRSGRSLGWCEAGAGRSEARGTSAASRVCALSMP